MTNNQTNSFRVVRATRAVPDDGGFVHRTPVYCVINQNDHVYAVFWGSTGGELAALAYRDKLAPTMEPPALGGHVDSGIYYGG